MKLILVFGFLVGLGPQPGWSNQNRTVAWGYNRNLTARAPSFWKYLPDTSCGGQRQSPINILTKKVKFNDSLNPIILRSQNFVDKPVSLSKHYSLYLKFNPHWKISFGFDLCLTPLTLHWHWGSDDSKGSEHLLDGKQFPMEAHLVSYNCDLYNSSDEAMASPDGLHVIGFFYKIGKTNEGLKPVINAMNHLIRNERDSVPIDEINPKVLLPDNLEDYFRYEGSLTTPPCTENVIWTVLRENQHISLEQISEFRKLTFPKPEVGHLVNNFRPLATVPGFPDFANRVVYSSFNSGQFIFWNMKLGGLLLLIRYLW